MNDRFEGTWSLVSFVARDADGREINEYGPAPRGYLMYADQGRMSVHITGNDRYFGYFGRYTVDEKSGIVTHHVEGASDPDFAGTNQRRLFTWRGSRLVLTTPPGSDVTYIATWEPSKTDA